MSRTYKDNPNSRNNGPRRAGQQRQISVRGIRREPPDVRKLGRAIIQLAMDEAAAESAGPTRPEPTQPTPKTEQVADD